MPCRAGKRGLTRSDPGFPRESAAPCEFRVQIGVLGNRDDPQRASRSWGCGNDMGHGNHTLRNANQDFSPIQRFSGSVRAAESVVDALGVSDQAKCEVGRWLLARELEPDPAVDHGLWSGGAAGEESSRGKNAPQARANRSLKTAESSSLAND